MEQVAIVTRWFALALLTGATVLYAYQFMVKRPAVAWWARFFTGAGLLALTVSIGLTSTVTDGTILTGPRNQLILTAWAFVVLYFVVEHLIKLKVYGTVLVPVSVVVLAVAQLVADTTMNLSPDALAQLDNWRVGIHVAFIVFANAGFAIGGLVSGLYLVQGSQLKHHRTNVLFRRLPSLGQTQSLARRAIVLAFPAYTAGILLGTLRAIETDVAGWWADPRVMLSGLVWLAFGGYLMGHYRRGISNTTAAWVALGGTALVGALSVAARTLPSGFHVFGLGS
ncbi:MAG: cytochrome c biogenesis protein CcsA [Actinomycetota bacterium]|nr:cytochrome c biogenesis protein CcsA [Actinomycetota bacterium]